MTHSGCCCLEACLWDAVLHADEVMTTGRVEGVLSCWRPDESRRCRNEAFVVPPCMQRATRVGGPGLLLETRSRVLLSCEARPNVGCLVGD